MADYYPLSVTVPRRTPFDILHAIAESMKEACEDAEYEFYEFRNEPGEYIEFQARTAYGSAGWEAAMPFDINARLEAEELPYLVEEGGDDGGMVRWWIPGDGYHERGTREGEIVMSISDLHGIMREHESDRARLAMALIDFFEWPEIK
jgi:hypothetical protein